MHTRPGCKRVRDVPPCAQQTEIEPGSTNADDRKAGASYIPVRGGSTAAANKIPLLNAISTISS